MSATLVWEKPGKEVLSFADLTLLMKLTEKYGIRAIVRQCKNSCEYIGNISLAEYLGEILN